MRHALRGFGPVLLLYVVIYGTLIAASGGVPYVTDGNESYSMLVHASNLYHFPISQTYGLSDEALGPNPAAHPYVYTHQGNFPRLFALLLYTLGARTAEIQVALTTFTIGLLSMFLIHRYLRLVSNAGFALLACAVFMTDYLLFAQWQVNTYRVWHGVFFFLSLLCVHGAGGERRGPWLAVTLANFACLFYFELAFGLFVATMTALYAGIQYRAQPRLAVIFWTAEAAGAMLAGVVLAGQIVGYLGWSGFLDDLRITYTARNLFNTDPTYVDRVREFVNSRHLVFWYNFASVDYERSVSAIVASMAESYFNSYTPVLWYAIAVTTLGWMAGIVAGQGSTRRSATRPVLPGVLLMLAAARFGLAVVNPDALVGVGGIRLTAAGGTWELGGAAAIITLGVAVFCRITSGRWLDPRRLPPGRTVAAAALLLIAEYLFFAGRAIFGGTLQPVWTYIQGTWYPAWVVQIVVAVAGVFAVLCVVRPQSIGHMRWPALASFVGCGLAAYAIVYVLSPGYVRTGYLLRLVPFASFLVETAIALSMYAAWSAAVHLGRRLRGRVAPDAAPAASPVTLAQRGALSLGTAVGACALLFLVFYWTSVQTAHIRLLPPTHAAFMRQLASPPYRGTSFAVDTYAAPVSVYTGEWAYFDTRLGLPQGGRVTAAGGRRLVDRDASTYLWLADRDRNAAYQEPQYFLCFRYQDLQRAAARLRGTADGCSAAGPVRSAMTGAEQSVGRELVARDAPGRDEWAIVRLDWSAAEGPDPPTEAGVER